MTFRKLFTEAAIAAGLLITALAIAAAQDNLDLNDPVPRFEGQTAPVARKLVASKPQYLGTSQCQFCHDQGKRPRAKGEEIQALLDRVRLDEMRIWDTHDPHRFAHQALTSQRAETMLLRLGKMRNQPDDKPLNVNAAATGCIQCHAIHGEQDDFHPGVNVAVVQSEGVSCEACHGKSSLWYLPHSQFQNQWLAKTSSAVKEQQFGLIDLHDSQRRAEVCLSCHLGNRDEGKMLTHEMYVAGHPPLSGFEIETAAERMPRHWSYPYESKQSSQNADDQFVRTRNVLVANLVALRECVKLMDADTWPAIDGATPEFSRFDCIACHHELGKSARPGRAVYGIAGRPAVRPWSLPLALVTAQAYGADGNLLIEQLTDIHQAFRDDVFATTLTTDGHPLFKWCEALINKVKKQPLTARQVEQLFGQICRVDQQGPLAKRGLDFDSARQVVGALWVTQTELVHAGKAVSAPQMERLAELRRYVGLDDRLYEQPDNFYAALAQLSADSDGYDQSRYEASLGKRLDTRADFSPTEFARQLEKLREFRE